MEAIISTPADIVPFAPSPARAFNPSAHLIDLKGKSYLPVAARLVWLREVHPDADITTTPIRIDDEIAIFAAHIAVPGRGSSSGRSPPAGSWRRGGCSPEAPSGRLSAFHVREDHDEHADDHHDRHRFTPRTGPSPRGGDLGRR